MGIVGNLGRNRIGFGAGAGRGRVVGGKANVRIIGLKELHKSFKRLSNESDDWGTKEAHRAAQRIAERASRDAPVDTSKMLKSITVTKGHQSAAVEVKKSYSVFVEKGTRRMNAQPFFYKHVGPSVDIMMKNLKKRITL